MTKRMRSESLPTSDQQRFVSVVNQLISAPGDPNPYGDLVAVHRDHMKYMMHPNMGEIGTQRFLTWHRVFLLKVEAMGQAIDPKFSVPYWEWTTQREVPPWLSNFRPTIRVPGDDITVTRNPPRPGVNLPDKSAIDHVLDAPDFTTFTHSIDLPHGTVHNWLNGTMSDFSNSPCDPLFWLHHAMIDKLWAQWQVTHPNEAPVLKGKWVKMLPWEEKYSDVKDIKLLGYEYE